MLESRNVTEEDLSSHTIFEIKSRNGEYIKITPKKINTLCLNLVKDLGIAEDYLPLPDNKYGIQQINLNTSRGDIYKNTFRHYPRRKTDLIQGYINYLLGINPPNVDFTSYINCEALRTQILLEESLSIVASLCMEE